MTDKVGTGYVPIKPDSDGFGPELEKQLDKEGTPAAKRSGERMSKAMKGAFFAGAAAIGKSVLDFGGFEKGMNEVFTLMPGISGEAMAKMEGQVKDFAAEFKVLPTEVVPALYEALGAGVPPDNVFSFLESAQKLAVGGVTELNTAVDGLSSVTNAYGTDVISAAEASDVMFKIVGLGKGTLDDVAGSLFNVTPIASALGVSFEDVGAAMALLSSKGTPVSVATTQIRAVLGELGKDGTKVSDVFKEISGKSFADFIAGGGNLQEALAIVQTGADEAGLSMMDMFGSIEAGSAALSLAEGDGAAFADAIGQMEGAAGSTEAAYDQMNQGLSATLDGIRAKLAVVFLNIGEAIAPTVGAIGEGLTLLLDLFSQIPGPAQAAIVLVGTLAAGLAAFAGPILKAMQLFKALNGVFSMLAANPWVLLVVALVAVTIVIIKNWDKVKKFLAATWDWMKAAGKAVADFFVYIWQSATELVSIAWEWMKTTAENVILWIGEAVLGMKTRIEETFLAIATAINGAWEQVKALTIAAWGVVTSTVSGAVSGVVGFITGIPSAIAGAFGTLANTIAAPFKAAFGAIKSLWNSTIGGFSFTLPDWIPFGYGGKSFSIPSMAAGGVLGGPQLFLGGEYPGASSNPEIVAPQNIMRETVVDALRTTDAAGPTVNLTMNVSAEVRDPSFFERQATELVRVVQRELAREARAAGRAGSVGVVPR